MTMPRVESVCKQFEKVDLAAGGRPAVEIKVVDMNISFSVELCDFRVNHRVKVVFLGGVRTLLEHRAHRRIAVDVGVIPLQIAVSG